MLLYVNSQNNSASNGPVARRPPGLEEHPSYAGKAALGANLGHTARDPKKRLKGQTDRIARHCNRHTAAGIQQQQPDFVFEQTSSTTGFEGGRVATVTRFRQSRLDRNRKCGLQKSRPQPDSDSPHRNSNRIPTENTSTTTGFRLCRPQQ